MIHRPSPAQHGKVFRMGGWVEGGGHDGSDCRCLGSLRKPIRSSCSSRYNVGNKVGGKAKLRLPAAPWFRVE